MFRRKGAALLAAAALLLAGCSAGGDGGGSTGSGTGPASGGTLTLGVITPASSFAAQNARWANESPYIQAVYDSLLKAAPDGKIEPNLATKWEYNADNTVLTLTLRKDVAFTDGTKLTADAAAKSILAFKAGKSPNKTNLKFVADAKAVDDTTLELDLSAPDPALLTYLTQNAGMVESPAALASPDVDIVPVGSGPYVLNTTETIVGNSYVFDKNKDYWNPGDQHYDKLVLNVYTDPTSLINAIQGGQVNGANVTDFGTLAPAQAAGFTVNPLELDWAGLLLSDRDGKLNPALAKLEVRQAINFALDRKALTKTMIFGFGTPTTQIFPAFSPSYDKSLDSYYTFDVAKAKQLMAKGGYAGGFTLKMARVSLIPAANYTLIADQLAAIGITVEYEDLQISDAYGKIIGGNYAASLFQLQQGASDWELAQFQIGAGSTWNVLHNADPTVEGLIAKMQGGDEGAGKELNKYLVENAWFAPFYRPQTSFVTDAHTKVTMQTGNAYPYLWNIVPA